MPSTEQRGFTEEEKPSKALGSVLSWKKLCRLGVMPNRYVHSCCTTDSTCDDVFGSNGTSSERPVCSDIQTFPFCSVTKQTEGRAFVYSTHAPRSPFPIDVESRESSRNGILCVILPLVHTKTSGMTPRMQDPANRFCSRRNLCHAENREGSVSPANVPIEHRILVPFHEDMAFHLDIFQEHQTRIQLTSLQLHTFSLVSDCDTRVAPDVHRDEMAVWNACGDSGVRIGDPCA